MANKLIDNTDYNTILSQIHSSWNEWKKTDEAFELMYGKKISNHLMNVEKKVKNLKAANEFKKNETPWSTKESVLIRNSKHANNLIELYIKLNIDLKERRQIWQFFEISSGIVGEMKADIKRLKRVLKFLNKNVNFKKLNKSEPLPLEWSQYATNLFKNINGVSLIEHEQKLEQQKKLEPQKQELKKEKKKKNQEKKEKKNKKNEQKEKVELDEFLNKAHEYVEWCRINNLDEYMVGMICNPEFLKKANEYVEWCSNNNLEEIMKGMVQFHPSRNFPVNSSPRLWYKHEATVAMSDECKDLIKKEKAHTQ